MIAKISEGEFDEFTAGHSVVIHLFEVTEEVFLGLLTPRLKSIGFQFINDYSEVVIYVKQIEFIALFNKWAFGLKEKLDSLENIMDKIDAFNNEIKTLIILGRVEKGLGKEKVMGLFGELSVLYQLLQERDDPREVLEGWNRPEPAIHDFDYSSYQIEVKAVGRSKTTLSISSAHQLEPRDKKLFLKVFKLDVREATDVDSLGDLYSSIAHFVGSGLRNRFEEKCASDSFASYLGPEHERTEYAITLLSEDDYVVKHDFPRVKDFPASISNIRYDLDISALEEFKINSNG